MSAADALMAACAAGVRLVADGDDLVLSAPVPPPASVLAGLARHKAEIVALLRARVTESWTAADWQAAFDERAGIAEFDHGLPRSAAEAQAMRWCLAAGLGETPFRLDVGSTAHQSNAVPKWRATGHDRHRAEGNTDDR